MSMPHPMEELVASIRAAQQRPAVPVVRSKLAPPLPFVPTKRVDGRTPQQRWGELFGRSYFPVADPAAELQFIDELADNMTGPCGCKRHWKEHREKTPPTIDTPANYEAWALLSLNTIRTRQERPPLTLDDTRQLYPLAVHATSSGGGIGDTIVALYACGGLAASSGRPVEFHARWSEWITRASVPGVAIVPYTRDYGLDISGGWDGPYGYHKATASAPSRVWAYCANLATGFGLAAFDPIRPTVDLTQRAPRSDGRYVVIAPCVSDQRWNARQWPLINFTELAAALIDQGYKVIGIGSAGQHELLEQVFSKLSGPAEWRWGISPREVTDLMLGAALTVANDSGIAHLGGLLSVPTVCIHAGSLPHDYLFGLTTTVESATSPLAKRRSDSDIMALASIPVGQVLAVTEQFLTSYQPDRWQGA